MTLFYTAVKSLETQASWLFERMETMAGELAECSPASTENRSCSPDSQSNSAESLQQSDKNSDKIIELERQLAASRQANTELADKLGEAEAKLVNVSQRLAASEAEKVCMEVMRFALHMAV